MSAEGYATPGLNGMAGKRKAFQFRVHLVGDTTQGNVKGYIEGPPTDGIALYLASASLTAPSDANFASLISFTAPAVIGFYLTDGKARYLHKVEVDAKSIQSPSMTAGVVTYKGASSSISGNTGVTTNKNIAFQISCTTLDLDAQVSDHVFSVTGSYEVE